MFSTVRATAARSLPLVRHASCLSGLRYAGLPPRRVTAQEAALAVRSHQTVYVQMGGATPTHLVDALVGRHAELEDVKLVHLHIEGKGPHMDPKVAKSFRAVNLFTGANARVAVNEGRADFVPIFLSDIPLLFRRGAMPVDVAFVHVSPPDKHGFVSLGISVDATLAAIQSAKIVIAQVNPNMPRTHGDGVVHINSIDAIVDVDDPIPTRLLEAPSAVEARIGEYVASLVEDGATLQMGIGAIPDAVLRNLGDKKQLGIHTEMFSDGVLDLIEKGIITGEKKAEHPNKIVTTFLLGSRRLYDFVHDNPLIEMREVSYTNNTHIISRNPKVTAINSAIEVDLTGQVCADSIGGKIFSGVGGQMDFLRGAALSEGGKPIIALPSTTSKGVSRIVTSLKRNAGVTTTRAHVDYIVTEYGIARLWGKSLRERYDALIRIAHPQHRDWLNAEVQRKYWLDDDPWAKTQKSPSPPNPSPVAQ